MPSTKQNKINRFHVGAEAHTKYYIVLASVNQIFEIETEKKQMRNVQKQYEKGLAHIGTHRDLNCSEVHFIMDAAKAEFTKRYSVYDCLYKAITLAFYFGFSVGMRAAKKS